MSLQPSREGGAVQLIVSFRHGLAVRSNRQRFVPSPRLRLTVRLDENGQPLPRIAAEPYREPLIDHGAALHDCFALPMGTSCATRMGPKPGHVSRRLVISCVLDSWVQPRN